jgi:hypothetical protein
MPGGGGGAGSSLAGGRNKNPVVDAMPFSSEKETQIPSLFFFFFFFRTKS